MLNLKKTEEIKTSKMLFGMAAQGTLGAKFFNVFFEVRVIFEHIMKCGFEHQKTNGFFCCSTGSHSGAVG